MVRVKSAARRRSRNHRSSVKRNAPAQITPCARSTQRTATHRRTTRSQGSGSARRRDFRQQIIDTAIRLFRKQGYEKTRVDEFVKILEISQPTFFRYFPSRTLFYEMWVSSASSAWQSASDPNCSHQG